MANLERSKEKALEKIQKFRKYEAGWNGYRSYAFDSTYLDFVVEIINKLEHPFEIFPLSSGKVQFEFVKDPTYIEIEILHDVYWSEWYVEFDSRFRDGGGCYEFSLPTEDIYSKLREYFDEESKAKDA